MSVRHILISCSLMALLGGASQGAWAMMGDEEDESSKKTATASQKKDDAQQNSQEEAADHLSDLRGAALERLMHYLPLGSLVNLSETSKHFQFQTQALLAPSAEEARVKFAAADRAGRREDLVGLIHALKKSPEDPTRKEDIHRIVFKAGIHPQLLNTDVIHFISPMRAGNLLLELASDPEQTAENLSALFFASIHLSEQLQEVAIPLKRLLAQHENLESMLRSDTASDLPMDDPVRLAVLREIAFDDNVELDVRFDAANDLPEGEEKNQILQELQALVVQEEQEADPQDENEVEVIF